MRRLCWTTICACTRHEACCRAGTSEDRHRYGEHSESDRSASFLITTTCTGLDQHELNFVLSKSDLKWGWSTNVQQPQIKLKGGPRTAVPDARGISPCIGSHTCPAPRQCSCGNRRMHTLFDRCAVKFHESTWPQHPVSHFVCQLQPASS